MAVGTVLAWTSPVLPELQAANSTLPVTLEEGSWIGSLLAVGAIAGSLPAGYLADRFGRKIVICATSAPFLISWALVVGASSVAMLYVARLLAGLATGVVSVVAPVYTSEVAETSVRGALGTLFQVMLTVGILFTYVVGAIADYTWLGIISATVPVALLLTFSRMPESPAHLVKVGKMDAAKKALRYFRGPQYEVDRELADLQKAARDASREETSLQDLVSTPGARRALVVGLGLMVFQQLSGINAVIFYSVDIFEAAGSTLDPKVAAIIVGVVQVVMSYAASAAVDRAGRRILLLVSASVMALCLALLGFYFCLEDAAGLGWLPLVCVTLFIIVFSLGFGPLPWMMMAELFAPRVKGNASSVAVCTNWTLVFLVTFSFGKLVAGLGEHTTFWIFAAICACATVFVWRLVPETKGKSLDEIQRLLSGERA
ncbi:facilitated trehalose transporter Tret1-like isoform X2 [Periplaneta americana]